jgi:hypothetical protein
MPKNSEVKIALIALIALAAWLFVGLPLLYLPPQDHVHGEFLGVKFGEWLLFLATVALAVTTWLLVKGAEKTAERQLRAYVCLFGGSIILQRVEQEVFIEGYVTLKNFGATPAYSHKCWVRIDLRAGTDPPFHIGGNGLTQAIIAPGGEANMPVHHGPISDQELVNIHNETKRIFVWGGSDYRDAFGTQRYFKFYCWNAKALSSGKGWPLVPANKPDEAN